MYNQLCLYYAFSETLLNSTQYKCNLVDLKLNYKLRCNLFKYAKIFISWTVFSNQYHVANTVFISHFTNLYQHVNIGNYLTCTGTFSPFPLLNLSSDRESNRFNGTSSPFWKRFVLLLVKTSTFSIKYNWISQLWSHSGEDYLWESPDVLNSLRFLNCHLFPYWVSMQLKMSHNKQFLWNY